MTYAYKREDTGEIVYVSFDQHMSNSAGFIVLPDGVSARRVPQSQERQKTSKREKVQAEIVSDRLGVTTAAAKEHEENARRHGIPGLEFKPDPAVPEFSNAHFSSWQAKSAYMKLCGMVDKNSRNGSAAALSPEQFERAKQRLLEAHA